MIGFVSQIISASALGWSTRVPKRLIGKLLQLSRKEKMMVLSRIMMVGWIQMVLRRLGGMKLFIAYWGERKGNVKAVLHFCFDNSHYTQATLREDQGGRTKLQVQFQVHRFEVPMKHAGGTGDVLFHIPLEEVDFKWVLGELCDLDEHQ